MPLANVHPSCTQLGECRTLVSIVWNCVTVILLCTWVAIHPNIPGPHDSFAYRQLRRVGIAIFSLIFPEFILVWAVRQNVSARQIRDDLNRLDELKKGRNALDVTWTTTHAFFLLMGGFMIHDPVDDRPKTVIFPPIVHILPDERVVTAQDDRIRAAMSYITEEEIKDKSKSSMLAKIIAVVQALWFIIQCIARHRQNLDVTQLEIVTIAFAALNFVTYAFWWYKPRDVECHIPIRLPANDIGEDEFDTFDSKQHISLPRALFDETIRPAFVDYWPGSYPPRWPGYRASVVLYPFLIIGFYLVILIKVFIGLIMYPIGLLVVAACAAADGDNVHPSALRVPTFLINNNDNMNSHMPFWAIQVFVVCTAFGATHCLAWNAFFPTNIERWIWRASALALTIAPVSTFWIERRGRIPDGVSRWKMWFEVAWTPATIIPILYALARATLIVQSLMLLASLPLASYQTVQWTTLIPHI